MISHILKPRFLTLIAASIFLISSCDSKEESSVNEKQTIIRSSDEDLKIISETLKARHDEIQANKYLNGKTSYVEEPGDQVYTQYRDLLATKNINIDIDARLDHIINNTFEENMQYVSDLHLYTANEIAAITAFKNELESSQNFQTSIANFENAILQLPLTFNKYQRFYYLIDALKAMYLYDPATFSGESVPTARLFGSCLSASIGLGAAFAGLAMIQVGSFGASTGLTVASFIWASAEWGAACKTTKKKEVVYPETILRPKVLMNPQLITFDEFGDLVDGPIRLFLTPKL